MARVASNADGGQRELHNAGHGVAIARAPHPALSRHGIAKLLVRSEGIPLSNEFKRLRPQAKT
jgi:hypothetical protein